MWFAEDVLTSTSPSSARPAWWRPTFTSTRRTSCTETWSPRTWCWTWRATSNWWGGVFAFFHCKMCQQKTSNLEGFSFLCVCLPFSSSSGGLWFCQGAGARREDLLVRGHSWVHGARDHQEPGPRLCRRLLVAGDSDVRAAGGKVTTPRARWVNDWWTMSSRKRSPSAFQSWPADGSSTAGHKQSGIDSWICPGLWD